MDDIVIVRSDNTIDFYLGNTRGLHLAIYHRKSSTKCFPYIIRD